MPKTIFDKLDECLARNDDGGDPDDPQPWGLFYDEENAYPLSLSICKHGEYNSYTETKLLSRCGPIAGSDEEITEILARRHDIPSKYPKRTSDNLKTLQGFVDALMDGVDDSGGDGFDTDESKEESATPAPAEPTPEPAKPAAKKKAAKKKAAPKEEEAPAVEEAEAEAVDVDDPELAALLNDIKNDK
jgi:hypothetical protein